MRVSADPATGDRLRLGRTARAGWLMLGLLLVAAGFIGIFVPLLPTMDFMLLALPCFARSSPRLEAWLLDHPNFGPGLKAWRNERAVPRRAKIAACMGMGLGYAIFWLHAPGYYPSVAAAAAMLAIMFWIVRRPNPSPAK